MNETIKALCKIITEMGDQIADLERQLAERDTVTDGLWDSWYCDDGDWLVKGDDGTYVAVTGDVGEWVMHDGSFGATRHATLTEAKLAAQAHLRLTNAKTE